MGVIDLVPRKAGVQGLALGELERCLELPEGKGWMRMLLRSQGAGF